MAHMGSFLRDFRPASKDRAYNLRFGCTAAILTCSQNWKSIVVQPSTVNPEPQKTLNPGP